MVVDSLKLPLQTLKVTAEVVDKSNWDKAITIATIVIAIANIFLIWYLSRQDRKSDSINIEKQRKLDLFKSLILEHKMDKLYKFYEKLDEISAQLTINNLTDNDKQTINVQVQNEAMNFRRRFIDVFLAIDHTLYIEILKMTDELTDCLTETIFDQGINLSHIPKFQELISKKIMNSETMIVKLLYDYKG